jgi:hypothetical protein
VTIPKVLANNGHQIADFHHQGVLVKKNAALLLQGFDEKLKLAADGKFLDNFIKNFSYKISDSYLSGFVLGGASLRNFTLTLEETSSFRLNYVSPTKVIRIKSKLRLMLILFQKYPLTNLFIGQYLHYRDKKFRKILGLKEQFK